MAPDGRTVVTAQLHDLGQSLRLDNITRELLTSGTPRRYIHEWSVTGLTSNHTICDHAIENSRSYDAAIRDHSRNGGAAEALLFELVLEDLTAAAEQTMPVDGGNAEDVLRLFAQAGVVEATLADQLQREGAQSFADSWNKLLRLLASKIGMAAGVRDTMSS
jgi:transaldolase